MLNMFTDDMRRNPYPLYDRMRSASALLHVPSPDFYMVFDYENVKRTLQDHDAFSSRASPPGQSAGSGALDWLIFFDPPHHTKLRAIVMRAFTPRVVASLEPRIRQLSAELLDQAIERGEMDLVTDFAVPLPLLVIADLIGIPLADRSAFKRWSDVMVNMSDTIAGGPEEAARAIADFRAATLEMGAYLSGLVEERRASPRDDLLTRLVEAEVDGERLSAKEILGFFQLLLVAGSETTTNLIDNAILCLLENPGELARLRSAPDLLPSAIEEVLRYRSPFQSAFRETRHEVEMHGQVIPAGKLVLAMTGSANRDPRQFKDPARFDITRDPNPHLAFGHGIHFCLGAPLARLESKVALSALLERLVGLRRASDEPWPPRRAFHVHGPTQLAVRFEPGRRSGR
jgi:cytochrome P450